MLRVDDGSLENIKTSENSNKDRLREVLRVWLKGTGHHSWSEIVKALERPALKEHNLAACLREKYCKMELRETSEVRELFLPCPYNVTLKVIDSST